MPGSACANARLHSLPLKTTYVGNTALKTGSECSFTPVNSASSPVFALSCLPRQRFQQQAIKQPAACNARGSWPAASCPRLIHRSIPGLCAQQVAKCLKNKHLAKSPGALGSAPGLLMLRTELSTWIVDKPRRYSSTCSFNSTIRSSARVSRCVCNCSRLKLCGTPSTAWAWKSSSPLMGAGTTSVFRLSRLTP